MLYIIFKKQVEKSSPIARNESHLSLFIAPVPQTMKSCGPFES